MRLLKSLLLTCLIYFTAALLAAGCSPAQSTARQPEKETLPAMEVFCRVGDNDWRRVLDQDDTGVQITGQALSFAQVWQAGLPPDPTPPGPVLHRAWNELLLPLPDTDIPCLGYALTYPSHQKEVSLDDSITFPKQAVPQSTQQDIVYRDHLDYEAEIGVLLHRNEPDRFGYLIVNDLTDRGIQVRTFDSANMAPGFTLAKSFEGSLRIGPLLAIGNAAAWKTLAVDLYLNGERRQQVRAGECLLQPEALVEHHQAVHGGTPWLLVSTGTSEGVLFDVPNLWEKIEYFLKAGFSMKEAQEDWLAHLRFLQPGDELTLTSPTLGRSSAQVVTGDIQ
jgi:2-keto-4-pentenoate hydratase/2-oxohepta-3-ene-1,7-dioic acid hydratase in catechol pathway